MFNKEQLEVINTIEGQVLVSASAGQGKSSALIGRVENMIANGINQEDIMITTFTNESAMDLKRKLSDKNIEYCKVGTFHSICRNILVKEGINVDKRPPANYIFQNEFKSLRLNDKIFVKDILGWIGYQKNYGLDSNSETFMYKDMDNYEEYELRMYFKKYEEVMKKYKCYDFEDWLIEAVRVLVQDCENKHTTKYLLVDEYQDSNKLQEKLVQLLCPSSNVCVFADEKQTLYSFRGSYVGILSNFLNIYPNAKVVKFKTNYRSCKNLVEQGNIFSRIYFGNSNLYADAEAFNQENGVITQMSYIDEEAQALHLVQQIKDWISEEVEPNEIAVLYRKNKCSFEIENELKKNDICYHITGNTGSFFERIEPRIFLAILRLIQNTNDDSAVEELMDIRVGSFKWLSKPARRKLEEFYTSKDISLFKACELYSPDDYNVKRNLGTFVQHIKDLVLLHNNGTDLYSIINKIQVLFDVRTFVEDKYESAEDVEERLESIESFKKFVKGNTLQSFISFVYSDIEMSKNKKKLTDDDVRLMSIHASKGLEFKKVIVLIKDGVFPDTKHECDFETEVNCMYVAVTRAKEEIYISEIGTCNKFAKEYLYGKDE